MKPDRPPAAIAGPRRARPATPPPLPAASPAAVAAAASQLPATSRALPALDYDESPRSSKNPDPTRLETTKPGVRRRGRRLTWFVLGIAFGAIGAAFARHDPVAALHAARAWSASAIRSLEASPAKAKGPVTVSAPSAFHPSVLAASNKPCPVDATEDDPCAELLAPFAAAAPPTVSIDDLPRVQPPPPPAPVVVHRPRVAANTTSAKPAATVDDEPAQESAPRGINPDAEDVGASPSHALPPAPPVAPKPAADPPATETASARNDAT